MTVVKPKPKQLLKPITTGAGSAMNQSQFLAMGLLRLNNHVVQNRHTGEQMTHWDMLKKATKFEFSLFNMFQCVIFSPVWRFCAT